MIYNWQEQAWKMLASEHGGRSGGILLFGRKGIGKLDFAVEFARSLLCENYSPPGTACGACPSCHWMATAEHPDLRLIEPAAARSVEEEAESGPDADEAPKPKSGAKDRKPSLYILIEQIRALEELLYLTAQRGGAKVVLIHPAESLYPNSANALLKILEEPPPATWFILVAHRPQHVLPTVRSRCRMIAMPAPDREVALRWLAQQQIDQPELALALAGGAPLEALAMGEADYQRERKRVLEQITAQRFDPLRAAEALADVAPARVLDWLSKWTYDVVASKLLGRVRYHVDFAEAAARLAPALPQLALTRYHRELLQWRRTVNHPLNPRLFLEQQLLSYAALTRTPPVSA